MTSPVPADPAGADDPPSVPPDRQEEPPPPSVPPPARESSPASLSRAEQASRLVRLLGVRQDTYAARLASLRSVGTPRSAEAQTHHNACISAERALAEALGEAKRVLATEEADPSYEGSLPTPLSSPPSSPDIPDCIGRFREDQILATKSWEKLNGLQAKVSRGETQIRSLDIEIHKLRQQVQLNAGHSAQEDAAVKLLVKELSGQFDELHQALIRLRRDVTPLVEFHAQQARRIAEAQETLAQQQAKAQRQQQRVRSAEERIEREELAILGLEPDPWTVVAGSPRPSSSSGKQGHKRVPDCPRFSGKPTDINVWLMQFEMWFDTSAHPLADKGRFAAMHLDGKAVQEWVTISARLKLDGHDPDDFAVFKTAALKRWGPVAPGTDARARLDSLKQTKSVESYYEQFCTIVAQAVDNPIVGAEACFLFQKGLKESINNLLLRYSESGALIEFTDVHDLAARAKALDSRLRLHNKANRPVSVADDGEWAPPKDKKQKRDKGKDAKAKGKMSFKAALSQPAAGPSGSGGPHPLQCFKCGALGHGKDTCTSPETEAGRKAHAAFLRRTGKAKSKA